MKSNLKSMARFLAILLALLAIGMHASVVVVPMLTGYKFIMLFVAFLLLLGSMVI